MVAVLLGIFCNITTAQIVKAHLEEVLATRTLKQAVAVMASYVRQIQPTSLKYSNVFIRHLFATFNLLGHCMPNPNLVEI